MQSSRLTLTWKLAVLVAAMFAFSFLMIPMFHFICHATGMHAKPTDMLVQKEHSQDPFRLDLVAKKHVWLPLELSLKQPYAVLIPGQEQEVVLTVDNKSNHDLSINVLASTGPEIMARKIMADFPTGHLDLAPNEHKTFTFHIGVGGDIPEHIKMGNLTLFFADENEFLRQR